MDQERFNDPGGISRQITRHYAKRSYTGQDSDAAHQLEELVATLPTREPPGPQARKAAAERHHRALQEALAAVTDAEEALKVAAEAARVARIEDWCSGYLSVQLEQWREKIAAQLRKAA